MNSMAKFSLALLISCLLVAGISAQNHEKQTDVPENRDCSCKGYEAKALECDWDEKTCDETSNSFRNYNYWCGKINSFRQDKREGNIPHNYNRKLTCKSNLSKQERDAIDRSLKTPINFSIWARHNPRVPLDAEVPDDTVDWSSEMTPIKDQGQCGSCWSFATVGYVEYWYQKTTGVTQAFSEQRLVSCDHSSFACNGGYQDKALDFLMNKGTVLSSDLPYTSGKTTKAGHCPKNTAELYKGPQTFAEYYIPSGSSFGDAQEGNCTRLKQLLAHGPVVGSMFATTGFQQYHTGVFTDSKCPTDGSTNHAIIITGFIKNYENSGSDVFVIKNSWGTAWGTNGYGYIAVDGNPCSLCSWFYYL